MPIPKGIYLGVDKENRRFSCDPAELARHVMCVGRRSTRRQLSMVLFEEFVLSSVPTLVVDTRGELASGCLAIPDNTPEFFEPFMNKQQAHRAGLTVAQFAAAEVKSWSEELEKWELDAERRLAFAAGMGIAIYTPTSTTGTPLSITPALSSPTQQGADLTDVESRNKILVTALLKSVGVADCSEHGRDHLLVSALLRHAWMNGDTMSFERLVREILSPPLARIGAIEIDELAPPEERRTLATRINSLVSEFPGWEVGAQLDFDELLWGDGLICSQCGMAVPDDNEITTLDPSLSTGRFPDETRTRWFSGKTPVGGCPNCAYPVYEIRLPAFRMFNLAHLDAPAREFFVAVLLNELDFWTRCQEKSSATRWALLFDDVDPYLAQDSSSRAPLLRLLRDAADDGGTVVLSTERVGDADEDALANVPSWIVGPLEDERARNQLIDALCANEVVADRDAVQRDLSQITSDELLLCTGKSDRTAFRLRPTMSYSRGVVGPDEIRTWTAATTVELLKEYEEKQPQSPQARPGATLDGRFSELDSKIRATSAALDKEYEAIHRARRQRGLMDRISSALGLTPDVVTQQQRDRLAVLHRELASHRAELRELQRLRGEA